MTSPSAAELRELLTEAPVELSAYRRRREDRNGQPEDENLRREALEYAAEVISAADALDQIEKAADPERTRVRGEAEDLVAAFGGSRDRAHAEAVADFRSEHGRGPLSFLRWKLKAPDLRGVIKHGVSRSLWDLEFEDESRVTLGNQDQIQEAKKVRGAMGAARRTMPRYKPGDFDPIYDAIILASDEHDTIASEVEETCSWLASFIEDQRGGRKVQLDGNDLRNVLADPEGEACFFDGEQGRLHVRLPKVIRHVTHGMGQRTTARDLSVRLGRMGFERVQLSARDGERTLKGRYWRSPPNFDLEGTS